MSSIVSPDFLSKQLTREEAQAQLDLYKFSEGKIYKIYEKNNETVIAYIGSTIQKIQQRWGGHKSFYKNSLSDYAKYVNDRGGPKNFKIELIENYPCQNATELRAREAHFIKTLKPVCNILMRSDTVEPEPIIVSRPEYICPKCNRVFGIRRLLTKHLNRIYKCDEGDYQCEKCTQRFNSSSNLSQHRKTCKGRPLSSAERDKIVIQYFAEKKQKKIKTPKISPVLSKEANESDDKVTLSNESQNHTHTELNLVDLSLRDLELKKEAIEIERQIISIKRSKMIC